MDEEDEAAEAMGVFLLVGEDAVEDGLRRQIAGHRRRRVIGVGRGARREVEEGEAELARPGRDLAVVPFVGGDEQAGRLAPDAEPLHLPEIGLEVGPELFAADQRLFPVVPGAIEQVLVGMGAQVVAVGREAADRPFERRRPVEVAGEEEGRGDALLAEDPADVLAAVGERPAGEDEGQAAQGRPAANDAVMVAKEGPAGVGPAGRPARAGDGEKGAGREQAGGPASGRGPDHFSSAVTFQPLILTAGGSPASSSVRKTPEIFRVSFGRSVT